MIAPRGHDINAVENNVAYNGRADRAHEAEARDEKRVEKKTDSQHANDGNNARRLLIRQREQRTVRDAAVADKEQQAKEGEQRDKRIVASAEHKSYDPLASTHRAEKYH